MDWLMTPWITGTVGRSSRQTRTERFIHKPSISVEWRFRRHQIDQLVKLTHCHPSNSRVCWRPSSGLESWKRKKNYSGDNNHEIDEDAAGSVRSSRADGRRGP